MTEPTTIECGNRRAVITGTRVQFMRLRHRPRYAPIAESVWPAIERPDVEAARQTAFIWTEQAFLDFEEQPKRKDINA